MGNYGDLKPFKEDPMRFPSNLGIILLAVYLILVGLAALISGFAIPPLLIGIIALAAGILLLIGR